MDNDRRMVDAQAKLISTLNDSIRDMRSEVKGLEARLQKYERAGKFYLEMQRSIIGSPVLQSEWDKFLVLLKMVTNVTDDTG